MTTSDDHDGHTVDIGPVTIGVSGETTPRWDVDDDGALVCPDSYGSIIRPPASFRGGSGFFDNQEHYDALVADVRAARQIERDRFRLNAAIAHFIAVRDQRAPSDIDIEAGTNDAPWWLDLRTAFDDVHDQIRALLSGETD